MQLNLSQQMQMSQQMRLAPRMIQSMEILQLPVLALEEKIAQELMENPLLELVNGDPDLPPSPDEIAEQQAQTRQPDPVEQPLIVDHEHQNEADFERLADMATEWPEDNYTSGGKPSSNRLEDDAERQHDLFSNLAERPPSLQNYLLEQLAFFDAPHDVRQFAEFIIHNLDRHGRLQNSLEELRQVYGRPITAAVAEAALRLIQQLDPPGVGARDVRECLLLQLKPDTPYRDLLVALIQHHLEDIAYNRLPLIQKKTGYTLEEIKAACEELRKLNPYPGAEFDAEPVQPVKPDVYVERDDQGRYIVRLEDELSPRLRISKKYQHLLQKGQDGQTRQFIKRKLESARWLLDSIEQRNHTLKRVAQAIVDRQTEFLDKGPEHIVPLKMQQIADVVGVHVTTVSRAVDDKWIQTPRGLFPLRRFFGGGTTTEDGEEVAWDTIRHKLKEIVDNEDKHNPLSDDDLVNELAKLGYHLARRTVTKYRKALNIPSSRLRRAY
ncbi:MAG: RNA polymerase sigma-54 factor [Planctomycetaceae bacterium]|nr:MAG: RNA polymerase sigma-54 factor [Planctomycetaceae bacterium]